MASAVKMYGPKDASHWSVGKLCPACEDPFKEGDFTTLISLGPGKDPEAQKKAAAGEAYNAVAQELHWSCATGEDPQERIVVE